MMKTRMWSLVALMFLALPLVGCGSGDEPAQNAGASNRAVGAASGGTSGSGDGMPLTAQQAAANPLSGQGVRDTADLQGTWLCITDGPFTGLEFLQGRKVLVSASVLGITQGADGIMMSYDILQGDRLTLTAPMGRTHVFTTVLAGDQLQLKDSQGEVHRYRRLAEGQTLVQAIRELQQAKMEAFQKQAQALAQWLKEGRLLLTVRTEAIPEFLVVAIEPKQQAGDTFRGVAWQEHPSPSMASATIRLRPDQRTMTTALEVTLGQQVSPAVAQRTATAGSFVLKTATDSQGRLVVQGPLRIGNHQAQGVLTRDETRHDAIVKAYDDLMARRAAIRQPLIDAMRDYAVLEGTAGVPGRADQQTRDSIILIRSAGDTPRWQGQVTSVNTTTGHTTRTAVLGASVMVENDKAVLVIPGSGKQYQLALDGGLKGHLSNNGRNAVPAAFEITQAMDKAAHDAQLQQMREKLMAIRPEMNLQGFVPAYGQNREKTPVVANLTLHADGKVTANVHYTMFKSLVTMEGSIENSLTGPAIELRFKDIPPGQKDVRISANMLSMRIRNQRWQLQVADTGPLLLLQGSLSGTNGSFSLVNADATFKAKHDAMLKNLLAEGTTLRVAYPDRDNVEPTLINLKLDQATGKITGEIASGGRHLATRTPAQLEGQIEDLGPWAGLKLLASRPNTKTQDAFELIVLEVDGRPALNGVFYPTHAPQAEKYVQLEQTTP